MVLVHIPQADRAQEFSSSPCGQQPSKTMPSKVSMVAAAQSKSPGDRFFFFLLLSVMCFRCMKNPKALCRECLTRNLSVLVRI